MAGSLSAVGLTILTAQIFTRARRHRARHVLRHRRLHGQSWPRRNSVMSSKLLTKVLAEKSRTCKLIAAQKISRPVYRSLHWRTDPHADRVRQRDVRRARSSKWRPGIASACSTPSPTRSPTSKWISPPARILTEGAAIDNFYVREVDGGGLSPERRRPSNAACSTRSIPGPAV